MQVTGEYEVTQHDNEDNDDDTKSVNIHGSSIVQHEFVNFLDEGVNNTAHLGINVGKKFIHMDEHEPHPSSTSAAIQATYQSIESIYCEASNIKKLEKSSYDLSHPQKSGTEVVHGSVRKIIEAIIDTTFNLLRTKCPRVTSITDVSFNQSYNSLSGDDIRDILKNDSDEFIVLLEEC